MGGLLAADALIQFVQCRPDADAPLWPRIIACLSYDTPVWPNPRLPLPRLNVVLAVPGIAPSRIQASSDQGSRGRQDDHKLRFRLDEGNQPE